jgi:hypothetical protein
MGSFSGICTSEGLVAIGSVGGYLNTVKMPNQVSPRIPSRMRWLAIAAGCVFGIVSFLHYGWFFLFIPSVLILGAVIQPRFPRLGSVLLAFGACIVTFYGLFLGVPIVLIIRNLGVRHGLEDLVFLGLSLASVVLIIWCDAQLVADARARR